MSCTFSNAITLACVRRNRFCLKWFQDTSSLCVKQNNTVLSSRKGRPLHPQGSHSTHISLHREGGYSPKTAPGYDGTTSWFEYEQLIDDGCDITTLVSQDEALRSCNSATRNTRPRKAYRRRWRGILQKMRPFCVKGKQYVSSGDSWDSSIYGRAAKTSSLGLLSSISSCKG